MHSKFLIFIILLYSMSCTTLEKNCPSISEEPISGCRASEHCKNIKAVYAIGLASGAEAHLGLNATPTETTKNHSRCIEKNLSEQGDHLKMTTK